MSTGIADAETVAAGTVAAGTASTRITDASRQDIWKLRSELYAFFGNSLLQVMTTRTALTLDVAFWEGFPLEQTNGHIKAGLAGLASCTQELSALDRDKAVERVGVEYTRLFIGPGKPAAPPWESLYHEGGTVLFGQPTSDMRKLFAAQGLKASTDSHQFEDHLGFELLYLGVTGARFVEQGPSAELMEQQADFIREHPLSFIESLWGKANTAVGGASTSSSDVLSTSVPTPVLFAAPPPAKPLAAPPATTALPGYYPALIELIWGFLLWDLDLLEDCD
ncbi:MAG: molecular chaperone TorD family protein [Coriobacteriales bacterium]|jgi:TorA maturation chaperone TorD|nr:molecular chaperone TorD family protein [Coriobacteriales bacterium]